MTPETIQAIHDSIQHWCRMRSDPIGCNEEPYTDHCALCKPDSKHTITPLNQ